MTFSIPAILADVIAVFSWFSLLYVVANVA